MSRVTYQPVVPRPRTLHKGAVARFLLSLYTDPASPLAYTALHTFARNVENRYAIPRRMTIAWLQEQRVYTKQRLAPKNYRQRIDRTYVTGIHETWQADLLDMGPMFAEHNDKKRFLLTIVDVLSRFAFVRPLQRKTPAEVVAAFESVVRQGGVTPGALHTDRGTEFYNTQMKAWRKKHDIRHYSTHSDKKAAMVERFNRTFKQTLVDYAIHTRQLRFMDHLNDFVNAYNARFHRTIKMAPQDVTVWNQYEVYNRVYGKFISKEFVRQSPQFQVGDHVRLSIVKANIFQRSYFGRWTEAIYRIRRIIATVGNPRYQVEELDGSPILGRFYADELQKVKYNPRQEFAVEAILDRRRRRVGRKTVSEVLVQWRGYPEKYNTWEPEANLRGGDPEPWLKERGKTKS